MQAKESGRFEHSYAYTPIVRLLKCKDSRYERADFIGDARRRIKCGGQVIRFAWGLAIDRLSRLGFALRAGRRSLVSTPLRCSSLRGRGRSIPDVRQDGVRAANGTFGRIP